MSRRGQKTGQAVTAVWYANEVLISKMRRVDGIYITVGPLEHGALAVDN